MIVRNRIARWLVAIAIAKGAHIVRVHDCALMKRVARMADAIMAPRDFP